MEKLMQILTGLNTQLASIDKRITNVESPASHPISNATSNASYSAAASSAPNLQQPSSNKSHSPVIPKAPMPKLKPAKYKGTPHNQVKLQEITFPEDQVEPFLGMNHYRVKYVIYHSVLKNVEGVDVSEMVSEF